MEASRTLSRYAALLASLLVSITENAQSSPVFRQMDSPSGYVAHVRENTMMLTVIKTIVADVPGEGKMIDWLARSWDSSS